MRVKQPEIIFEDDAVIVCRKEAGVAVQTARAGQADMVSLLKNYRAKKKEEPYIGLIHRLDMQGDGHFRIQLQQLRQQPVGKLRCHDLQIRGRTPCRTDAE